MTTLEEICDSHPCKSVQLEVKKEIIALFQITAWWEGQATPSYQHTGRWNRMSTTENPLRENSVSKSNHTMVVETANEEDRQIISLTMTKEAFSHSHSFYLPESLNHSNGHHSYYVHYPEGTPHDCIKTTEKLFYCILTSAAAFYCKMTKVDCSSVLEGN